MVKEKKSGEDFTKIVKKLSKNYWAVAAVVLAILLVVTLFTGSGSGVSTTVAGEKVLDFAQQQGVQGTLLSVEDAGNLYMVTLDIEGQEVPVYITKDGKNFVPSIVPLTGQAVQTPAQTQQPAPANIPKSDKPKVELFVMTHCPYGTQAEKGYLPTIQALDDKIDSSVKFVHYFLHEPENAETPIQSCIREEQPSKFMKYLLEFLKDGDSDAALTAAGVNKAKLDTCISSGKADEYYAADSALSEGYGVRGSPTLVVNGVIADSGRSSAAYLDTICAAFTDSARPSECDTLTLDSASPSPGFGYGASTGAASANAQC
jgi:protein-disulfide isomerase